MDNWAGHDNQRDEAVGYGQGHKEVVGHVLQFLLDDDGDDDEHVTRDAGRDDDKQEEHFPHSRLYILTSASAAVDDVIIRRVDAGKVVRRLAVQVQAD